MFERMNRSRPDEVPSRILILNNSSYAGFGFIFFLSSEVAALKKAFTTNIPPLVPSLIFTSSIGWLLQTSLTLYVFTKKGPFYVFLEAVYAMSAACVSVCVYLCVCVFVYQDDSTCGIRS